MDYHRFSDSSRTEWEPPASLAPSCEASPAMSLLHSLLVFCATLIDRSDGSFQFTHILICLIDLRTVRIADHRLELGHGVAFRVDASYSRDASRKWTRCCAVDQRDGPMKQYEVFLEISGPTAMWTRPDTGDAPVSYPAPSFAAVKGIFESIVWLKSAEVVPTRVEICAPLVFHTYSTNYGGPLAKSCTR